MKKPDLTPGEMTKARKNFYLFNLFNVISFSLLSGNIITLYALKLGAGNFLVGMLSSFIFLGTFFNRQGFKESVGTIIGKGL